MSATNEYLVRTPEFDGQDSAESTFKARNGTNIPIQTLPNDILLHILEIIAYSHSRSLQAIRLVCSKFDHLATYAGLNRVTLNFTGNSRSKSVKYLGRIERRGLLVAIRAIKITYKPIDGFGVPKIVDSAAELDSTIALEYLGRCLPSMRGLRDITLPAQFISKQIALAIPDQTRLHLRLSHFDSYEYSYGEMCRNIVHLRGSPKLSSVSFITPGIDPSEDSSCAQVMRALRPVLVSCTNLKCLTLVIHDVGAQGGGPNAPLPGYEGFGFIEGEIPVPLEQLRLQNYRFGRHAISWYSGYPASAPALEETYWVQNLDWSRLKALELDRIDLALSLMPKLVSLKRIKTPEDTGGKLVEFFMNVPSLLTHIFSEKLADISLDGVLRHSPALKVLELHQPEYENWDEEAISYESLQLIREKSVGVEELRLDIVRAGTWPFDMLTLISSFPRLRRLTIWFRVLSLRYLQDELKITELAEPLVTHKGARTIFEYLLGMADGERSQLSEVQIHSGCLSYRNCWSYHGTLNPRQSQLIWKTPITFICSLPVRDDQRAAGELSVVPGEDLELARLGPSLEEDRGIEKHSKRPDITQFIEASTIVDPYL